MPSHGVVGLSEIIIVFFIFQAPQFTEVMASDIWHRGNEHKNNDSIEGMLTTREASVLSLYIYCISDLLLHNKFPPNVSNKY